MKGYEELSIKSNMNLTIPGERFIISNINTSEKTKNRLYDIGITKGTEVVHLFDSPPGDPSAYFVRNTIIALRKSETQKIEVFIIE